MSGYYYRHPENNNVVWSTCAPSDDVNPWRGWEQLDNREGKQLYQVQCREKLKTLILPCRVLYSLTDAARSGATRYIRLYIVSDSCNILEVTKWVAFAFGYRIRERSGREYISTTSCASDVCNHVAWELGIGESYRHEHL